MSELQERATRAEVALDAQATAQETLDASESERLGKLKVNVVAAHGAVDEDNKPVAQGELTVAEARLIDVQPDPAEQAAAAQRKQLVAEGRMQEAQIAYGIASKDAQDKAVQIGVLTTERDSAKAEAEQVRREATDALAAAAIAQADAERQVTDAKAQEAARIARETREWQIHAANWAGGGLFVATLGLAAAAWFIPISRRMFGEGAIVAMALCVGCFAFARLLGNPLFLPVACGAYGVGLLGWAAWKVRSGMREKAAAKIAEDNARIVADLVPMLDDYYDKLASPEAKADMAAKLFPALEAKGGAYDAAVKRFKAADCEDRPPSTLAKSDKTL